MKAHIQRGQPSEDCWICYLPTGRGIGPMGFGNTPAVAYDDYRGLYRELLKRALTGKPATRINQDASGAHV